MFTFIQKIDLYWLDWDLALNTIGFLRNKGENTSVYC